MKTKQTLKTLKTLTKKRWKHKTHKQKTWNTCWKNNQPLRIQWFEHTWLTKRSYTMVWTHIWITNRYDYIGLSTHGSPNVAQAMLWAHMAHQPLHKQWFEHSWATIRYDYNGLSTHCSPNVTQAMVGAHVGHQTVVYVTFGGPCVLKPLYTYSLFLYFPGCPCFANSQCFPSCPCFPNLKLLISFICFWSFPGFPCFPSFPCFHVPK